MSYADSFWSLLPPLLALTAAVISRRVILSLGLGIGVGVLLLGAGDPLASLNILADKVIALVWEEGGLNSWNLSIIAFLLLLGMLTSLMSLSGATQAFANWAIARVKSARGARLLSAGLGVLIFIDDYFNSLAVGSVSRPITDKLNISRAKLAYLLDSTAAPMCVLMPVSSWGAYIIAIIGGILVSHQVAELSALHAFVALIPMNFYALFAILMVLAVAYWPFDLAAMKRSERKARQGDVGRLASSTLAEEIQPLAQGQKRALLLPLSILLLATLSLLVLTGANALTSKGLTFELLAALENTDVGLSLVGGGVLALLTSLAMLTRQRPKASQLGRSLWLGLLSMRSAIIILLFAWCIGSVISSLETGKYLASFVGEQISAEWLPLLLFVIAGGMAFATGTSWGTFGIMLPIAGDMAAATEISLLLPLLAAVLSGAVFGDHCSPISDTTILSSTGAGCDHIEHVRTQLPYALGVALISCVGYLLLGFTGSVALSLALCLALFVGTVAWLRHQSKIERTE